MASLIHGHPELLTCMGCLPSGFNPHERQPPNFTILDGKDNQKKMTIMDVQV